MSEETGIEKAARGAGPAEEATTEGTERAAVRKRTFFFRIPLEKPVPAISPP